MLTVSSFQRFTGPLSPHRPSHQSWSRLYVPGTNSATVCCRRQLCTHSPTQTLTSALLKHTTLETLEFHLILVRSKMSRLLAQRGKNTVWEWGPDTRLSVFPESCPDHPGKYMRANPFQVESMTRDCHINQCRPSPAQAGNAMGVVGGTTVRFLGKDYGLRHTAGRLKLDFSLPLRGGLGCREASHICEDLFLPLEWL